MKLLLRLTAALAATALTATTAEAQTGTVSGRVSGTDTRPLSGAQIVVEGTRAGTLSDVAGRFSITDVPLGSQRVTVEMIGFATQTLTVDVQAVGVTTADFMLAPVVLRLDEIVVTATGSQARRELGNSIARVDASSTTAVAPVTSFQELLQGRAAGINVLPSSGTVGMGSRIRIRGISSATLSANPMIYVDGIRVSGESPGLDVSGTAYVGGGEPSFFNDLNPEEIESIEIVKGPSAATLYGTQAANGVILITTKRGTEGPARWSLYLEQGVSQDPSNYPGIYFSQGTDGSGAVGGCLPLQQAAGACTIDELHSRNVFEEPGLSPIATGHRQQYGIQVRGGGGVRYFVSAELEKETGTLRMPSLSQDYLSSARGSAIPDEQINPNDLSKVNLRANLTADLTDRLELNVSTGLIRSRLRLPQTGNNVESILGAGLLASADPNSPAELASDLGETFAHLVWVDTDRFINSSRLNWSPTTYLTAHATVGMDYTAFSNEDFNAPGQGCVICGQYSQGLRGLEAYTNSKYSMDAGGSALFDLTDRITSRTAVGVQLNTDRLEGTINTAFVFPPGGSTIDAGSNRSSAELTVESRTLGTYLEQQFGLDDRLYVTGAVRVDQNSAFGEGFEAAWYPKASASFVVFDRNHRWLSTLRVRGAYGQSGLQPDPNAALRFLLPVPSTVMMGGQAVDVPSVTIGGVGNIGLRPERSAELELGFDAVALNDRIDVDFTFYRKRTTDALVERVLPGSLGVTQTRFENLGEVANQGFELMIDATIVETDDLSWRVGLSGSKNSNELVSLGEGVPPIRGAVSAQVPGFPLDGSWAQDLESWADANGDGVIDFSEVVVSDTALYLGSTVPTTSAQMTTSVTLAGGRVQVGGLLDYQGGFVSLNMNHAFQCAFVQNCRAINDPTASLEEQAIAIAPALGGFGAVVEGSAFLKMREAYVRLSLPDAWASGLRARSISLVLTGRNLFTITEFSGWDPEINTNGSSSGPTLNLFDAGQLRTFLFRVNLEY